MGHAGWRDSVAVQRYLQRHIQPGLPTHTFDERHWAQVVVLPAYGESPALLTQLQQIPAGNGRTLVILVLNRPDADNDRQANTPLRSAIQASLLQREQRGPVSIQCLNGHTDLYLLDMEELYGATPAALSVGLARKTGCDLALHWMLAGAIGSQWLCCTDADATLPPDYFQQLDNAAAPAVAAVFPFRHVPQGEQACDTATALYELRLHHYVLGLEYAGSPYAYHTLGSCLAIRADAYTQVRGFPRRAGAEDFYVLNKLAKVGPIARLAGSCIQLQSRHSARIPFGTGPAVAAIVGSADPQAATLFYHPQCFVALRALLACLPEMALTPVQNFTSLLQGYGLDQRLAEQMHRALLAQGIPVALAHCQRQSTTGAQFQRQFHQWFDGFRTLKCIHALRDAGWQQQSLAQLAALPPNLWPATTPPTPDMEQLRHALARHWHWQVASPVKIR